MPASRADRRNTIQTRAQALAGPCASTGVRAATSETGFEDKPKTTGELWLYGVVGGFWFGFDSESVAYELRRMGDVDEIVVRLDSPGGAAHQGISIANLLANHSAKVIVVVDGLAASAASMIALGGEELVMSPGSQMMLHDAWMLTVGNAAELHSDAEWLDKQSQNYAETYAHRAGKTAEHWRSVMQADDGRGTWFTAQEAVDAGLADTVANIASTTTPPPDPAESTSIDEEEMAARAAWDLEVLVHPSARAAWTQRQPQARAPKPPSASAVGSTETEGGSAVAFSDEQLTTMRAELGLPETADEAAIVAAVKAVVEDSLEDRPTDPPAATVPEGMTLVSTEVLDELRAGAQAGRDASRQLQEAERDRTIEAALKAGKITAAQREHFSKLWDADSDGTRTLLDGLAAGLVPVSEHGHDNPVEESQTEDDAVYDALFPDEQKAS